MHSVDEIRLEQGDFVFVRKGSIEPLSNQELHGLLLVNMENLIDGRVSAVVYEELYLQYLAIEQRARDV